MKYLAGILAVIILGCSAEKPNDEPSVKVEVPEEALNEAGCLFAATTSDSGTETISLECEEKESKEEYQGQIEALESYIESVDSATETPNAERADLISLEQKALAAQVELFNVKLRLSIFEANGVNDDSTYTLVLAYRITTTISEDSLRETFGCTVEEESLNCPIPQGSEDREHFQKMLEAYKIALQYLKENDPELSEDSRKACSGKLLSIELHLALLAGN
jgi:hypothetical protein